MIGQTISHYKILEKLGEGGMGVVYKAEDLKLKRIVAIKFLPKKLSVHGEERERFEHEAQAASSLNHPNICTIYEIDEQAGETFIVMEYIEGITLRDWIQKKMVQAEGYRKLSIKETVEIAIQIADGLEKAHEKGIVHRDIKSENIMVTEDGRAKIMDFGLAKLKGVSKLTKTGSTVGTIAYMSPEQVEGLETDNRTDIFSFGVLFYEMLTGSLPFRAEHEAALMYEIINMDPKPLTEIRQSADAELNRIVMKCLEKDRDVRYQSMREVAVDLKRYKRDSEGRKLERPQAAVQAQELLSAKRRKLPLAIAALVVLIGVVAAWFYFSSQVTKEPVVGETKVNRVTADPGLEDQPTWSPDGKFLAYTTDERGNLDIVVLPLAGGQPIRIADTDADEAEPSWSPDGTKLAFVSARDHGGRLSIALATGPLQSYIYGKGGDIFLIPALGGTPVKLVENGYGPAWSPDGKNVVFRSARGGQWDLWIIPAGGGTPKQLTNDPEQDYSPSWSPDGRWIIYGSLFTAVTYFEIRVVATEGGEPRSLIKESSVVLKPALSPEGKFILFSSDRGGSFNLWKTPFSPSGEMKAESPVRVTIGGGDDVNISIAAVGKRLAYATVRNTADIWELTLRSKALRQMTFETTTEDYANLSPDGKTLLVESDRTGKMAVWTFDLNGKALSQHSPVQSFIPNPVWSPDGKQIAYSQEAGDKAKIVTRNLGDLSVKEIATGQFFAPAWSPDGKKLGVNLVKDGTNSIWVYWFEKKEMKQITPSEMNCIFPAWSPDGGNIVFNVEERGTRHIWIVPSEGGTPRQITSGEYEYSHPKWSPVNNDLMTFLRDHKNVCVLSLNTGEITQLTNFVEANIVIDYPSWSYDGKKVYFSLFKKVGDIYTLENY
ncbi:MAG: PD40 domain-containing protein [Ignavibacteriae bacterium]|nr:PD40 domain-containing protein [Ignavibacteriota bacterium]